MDGHLTTSLKLCLGTPFSHGYAFFAIGAECVCERKWSDSHRVGAEARNPVLDLEGHASEGKLAAYLISSHQRRHSPCWTAKPSAYSSSPNSPLGFRNSEDMLVDTDPPTGSPSVTSDNHGTVSTSWSKRIAGCSTNGHHASAVCGLELAEDNALTHPMIIQVLLLDLQSGQNVARSGF